MSAQAIGEFYIGGNAEKELRELVSMLKNTVGNLEKTVVSADKADKELSNIGTSADNASGKLDKTGRSAKKTSEEIDEVADSAKKLQDAIDLVVGSAIIGTIVGVGKAAFDSAVELDKQRSRLSAMAGDEYPALKASIDDVKLSMKGMASETEISDAVAVAMQFGASTELISSGMDEVMMISKSLGKESKQTFQQVQQFVQTGQQAFFEENAIFNKYLGDLESLGTGVDEISKKKREAKVLEIFSQEEVNIANMFNKTLKDGSSLLEQNTNLGKETMAIIGGVMLQALVPLLSVANDVLLWLSSTEEGMKTVKIATIAIAPVIGGLLVGALYSATTAAWSLASGVIAATYPFILAGLAIGAVVLIIEDLYQAFTGGESILKDFALWIIDGVGKAKDYVVEIIPSIVDKVFEGISSLIAIAKEYGPIVMMFLFPISALYFYWDEIMAFLGTIPDKVVSIFTDVKSKAMEALGSVGDFLFGGEVSVSANTGKSGENIEHRASGGIVEPYAKYQVNENGTEYLQMGSQGGFIHPAGSVGGGKSVSMSIGNIIINVNDVSATEGAIINAVKSALDKLCSNEYSIEAGLV